jgi:integrase/recombinase XerD
MKYKIKEYLTKEERNLLLRQPDQRTLMGLRDFCLLGLLVFTGMRRAEICALNRGDLKVEGKRVLLFIWGKGGRQRKSFIKNPELILALERYFKMVETLDHPEAPMFFRAKCPRVLGLRRITTSTIRFCVRRYVKSAGIKKRISPHSLRHTFCTLAMQSGADLATVQALAGHRSISTTSRYLHTSEELMEKAIERLAL